MSTGKRILVAATVLVALLLAGAWFYVNFVDVSTRYATVDVGFAERLYEQGKIENSSIRNATIQILDRHPLIKNETLYLERHSTAPPLAEMKEVSVSSANHTVESFAEEFGYPAGYRTDGTGLPYVNYRYNDTLYRVTMTIFVVD